VWQPAAHGTLPKAKKKIETEWFNVVAWSSLAEICKQHLSKGQQVYIEGRLQTRHWDDAEGNKHTSVEIVANEMIILGERRDTSESTASEAETVEEDEFPF
jgi:single-strand DNA-binding protein